MSQHDRKNFFAPSTSSADNKHEEFEKGTLSSERGHVETIVPKSAIDVALELIAQEELEERNAARIAALNKPKPRGRPPLPRKTVENTPNAYAKAEFPDQRKSLKQNEAQADNSQSPILTNEEVPSPHTVLPATILKDHLEVEVYVEDEPRTMQISLFGADDGEPESADFHKMVLLNYGSADGRLKDDEYDSDGSAPQRSTSKVMSPSREEVMLKKGSRTAEEDPSNAANCVETRTTVSVCGESLNSSGGCSTAENEKTTSTQMETEEQSELAAPSRSRKRRPHEKRSRGRPRKNKNAFSPPKIGRPRGRPRKEGCVPVQRIERKSIEKKSRQCLQTHRPRRAVAMIQDFLELYAKVDLADLEFIHARATTFVKMLVDGYVDESKAKASSSPTNSDTQNSSPPKAHSQASAGLGNNVKNEEEFESSTEEVALECEYDSSSEYNAGFGENGNIDHQPLESPRSPTDSFIDAIPVIRGTALQQLPTVIDSI